MKSVVVGAFMALVAGGACAQTAEDIARLNRMARERGDAVGAANTVKGAVRQERPPREEPDRVRQLRGLWECSGNDEGQPVYMQPRFDSEVMGRTTAFVATQGERRNGFVGILHSNGHKGWVPERSVMPNDDFRPLIGADNRPVRCSVLGVRDNGQPVFQLR